MLLLFGWAKGANRQIRSTVSSRQLRYLYNLARMNKSSSTLTRSLLVSEAKAFLTLAIPLAGVQLSQAAIGFVDTLMMGRIGLETLAAGGLATLTFSVFLYMATGVVMGVY